MQPIKFSLNEFQYSTNDKLTLIQACLLNKIDIPRFCFHERLSVAGNCRMCLVEDAKQIKPVAACAMNLTDLSVIFTNSLRVKKAREAVLEFLLANHPLDCPICDQGGECDLQDQSIIYGGDRGRFYELKRSVEDKDCGPLIKTIMNRCIHCTRCVRFGNEIAGTAVLGLTGRGSKMEIGFYIEKLMNNELSGNIIDLCPVGALTSKPFSFTSRPWELKSYDSIDILDELHSNIRIDVRGTKIMRILPRSNVNINGDWITDKIRFSYDAFRRQRLYEPMVNYKGFFIKVSWKSALSFLKMFFFEFLKKSNNRYLPLRIYLGGFTDLETVFMLRKFSNLIGCALTLPGTADNRLFYTFNTPLTRVAEADICVLVDVNLRLTSPLINSKIRSISFNNNTPIYIISSYSNLNYYAKHLSSSSITLLSICEGTHWLNSKILKGASLKPLFILNSRQPFLYLLTEFIFSYTNVLSSGWVGLNILNNSFTLKELGLFSTLDQNFLPNSINFLCNYDDNKVKNTIFNIYQGHHGDLNAIYSNIILPSTSFVEKASMYCNVLGLIQKTRKALFKVGNSRDDWKILNAFFESFVFKNFRVETSFDIVALLTKVSPFILYKNNIIEPVRLSQSFVFGFFNFVALPNNFYLSDSISRNSKVMSLCHVRFCIRSYNFVI